MKHKLLSLFFAAIVAMNVFAADVWDGSSDIFTHGAGTEQSPYLIENAEQLAFIAEMVNAGVYTYSGNYFKLTTDLDLNNLAWTPIGDATHKFGGNFDGDGHTISNLKITASTTNAGLFGVVSGGTYKKLTVQGSIASSANATNAGGLIAYGKNVYIDSCINYVEINSSLTTATISYVGGIMGYGQDVSVSNCTNNGNVKSIYNGTASTSNSGVEKYVGGILGYGNNSSLKNYHNLQNYGTISSQTIVKGAGWIKPLKIYMGGIVGDLTNGTMTRIYNFGALTLDTNNDVGSSADNATTYVGGLCGAVFNTSVSIGENSGNISVKSRVTGSWMHNWATVPSGYTAPRTTSSFVSVSINKHNDGDVGGLLGYMENGFMSSSKNTGYITTTFSLPAGNLVVGDYYGYTSTYGNTWWCDKGCKNYFFSYDTYCASKDVSATAYVGGIVGDMKSASIYSSCNNGNIASSKSGGLVGHSTSSNISYSYNTGDGYYYGIGNAITTKNSYNVSKASTIGISSGTVTNSYYINGSGNGTQKTDAQMKSVSMPILLNADSTVFIQDVQPYVNKGYPIFKHGMKYIATNDASDVSYTSAQLNGNYYNCNPTSMGFEYKKSSASSYSSKTITNASPAQYILTGLTQGTTYDVRYWLVDNGIKYYGEVVQFTTLACPTKPVRSDTVTLCDGESYDFAGKTLTKAGTYRDSLVATTGCDSVIELVLKVYDTYKYPQFDTINRGESYDFYGQMLTEPGVYNEYIRTTNRCNWVQLNLYVIEPPKTLTLNVNNPQWGSVTGAGTYEHGEVVEFSAVPAAGCYLVNWSDGETNAVRAMTLTKDTTITANFAIHQFTINTEAANGSVSGGGTYNYGTQVTLTATADEHYHFVRWNDGNTEAARQIKVTEDKTYSAVFELDKFLVTFRNDDGTVLKSEEVEYGTMPIAPADPTKESTAQYDYTFAGWTPTIAIVTQAATYTATYTSALREYLVTFLNDDNTVISSKNYKYGETPVAPADPIKQNTAEYTYSFNGWDNAIAQVQGPQTYKATFTATKNSYTITWQDENGSLINQTTVEYGVVPIHAEPIKQATAEYTYTFVGWTPAVVAVMGNATYKATFNATKNKYLITFRDENGTELKSEEVEYGVMPIAPTDPTKESTAQYDYTFAGWTPAVAIVTQAATYTATYTSALREYLVTFLNDDNTVISSKNYKYGETPIAPADPVKQNTAEYTYMFNGWDNAIAQVQGPQTYKATYTATKNSYTITWQNEDGSLIDQTTVEYGQIPAHADPIKQNTAEYTYTFAGWTPTVVAVTGDATYKATFTATKNSYTITWQDEDGSLIDQTTVEYGQIPAHAEPTKEATAEYTYTFAGWTPAVVAVTGDATYKATFTATKNSYTITWQNEDGSLIDQTTVEYGQIPAHADPVKLNTAEYTYTFSGWTPTVVAVIGNATYRATFTATKNKYLITFRNDDGTVLKSEEVEYGMLPIAPATPTKESTAQYNYEFAGWTPSVTLVSQAATYTATYNSSVREYLVTFLNDDNSIISMQSCKYGSYPTIPSTPTKQATAEYTYTFAGWTPAVVAVTGDATYKATFLATKNSYTITWQNEDGSLIDQTTVEYGVVPTHAEPTKEATEEYTYTFTGWTPAVVAVTGDATYKATFSSVVNVYTISVSAANGQVIGGGEYQYGATIDLTAIPDEGYVFDQWSDGVTDNPRTITVTGDAEYTALFTSTEGFENIYTSEPVQKVIIDQNVYILRGDKVYNAQGALVK